MIDLEMATTLDILAELRRRKTRFAFIGYTARNCGTAEVYTAALGSSADDILDMIDLLHDRICHQVDEEPGR